MLEQQYKKILVAIDGSDEADLAFKKAVNVAKRNQASLLIAHVIDTRAFQNLTTIDDTLVNEATKTAKETMMDYVKSAQKQGLDKVSYVIEYGTPKPIIGKQLPEEHDIDLIMVGATGLNAVERLFIGSVSEYIIRQAPCDVLVVRTDLNNKVPEKKSKIKP